MNLEFTGERVVPDKISENGSLYIEHITRYMFAEQYVRDEKVLDAGCGCGYGTHLLSQRALSVIGTDISKEAIDYCKMHYNKDNIEFYQMDCCQLLFPKESFDVVISFEFIEHIADYDKFLKEVNRVLKKDGTFILSTPNKIKFPNANNPYHISNFDCKEFMQILRNNFSKVTLYGQKINPIILISKKLYFLQEQVDEIQNNLDHLPLFFIKSLIPKSIKNVFKQHIRSQFVTKADTKRELFNSQMSTDDIKISNINIEDAECLIGICEK